MRRFAPFALLCLMLLAFGPAITLAQPPGKPDSTSTTPTPATEPNTGAPTTPTSESLQPPAISPTQAPAGSPSASIPRLNLAAMVLDSTAVPEGYTLFYEIYIPGSRIGNDLTGGAIPQEEVDATGLQWYYESVYISADGNTRLRSYVEQYAGEDGAMRGFDLLENEQRLAPQGSIFTDGPGAGVGQEPSEISEGSLQPSGTPMAITSVDSTFRTGNLLAGVSVDTVPGTVADKQVTIDLSQVLFDRIQSVLASQPLPLIDYALPGQLVTLGPEWLGHDEGYLAATEIYGPDNGATAAPAFVSGYFTNESPANSTSAFPVPLVSINVSEFQDESMPLQLVSQPGVLQPPFDGVQPLDIDPIPGSSVTQAFQYVNPLFTDATEDSIRVVMVVGGNLVFIDIQGNKTLDGAREAAIQIAAAQAACLQSTTPCPSLSLPAGLLESPQPPTPAPLPSETPLIARPDENREPEGVVTYNYGFSGHSGDPVEYTESPPVGGTHNPVWQTCEFYDGQIASENAVHSLEHGAVWITYRPDISEIDKETLKDWANDRRYLLVSEYDDQASPFVFTAWNNQLALDSLSDERAIQFMNYFIQGPQTPERGASCSGGNDQTIG